MFVHLVLLPFLVFAPLHLSVLAVRLSNAPSLGWPELAPAAIFLAALLIVWGALRIGRYSGSPAVPSAAMALLGAGIALQFRVGTFRTVELQSPSQLALPIGIVSMLSVWLLLRRRRIDRLEPWWGVFLGASIVVIAGVLVAGHGFRGAKYLSGGMNPVEIVKPLLVVFVASILSGHRRLLRRGFLGVPLPPLNILVTVGLLWAPPMLLLIAQGDLGMFALLNATLLVMLYAVTNRSLYFVGGFAALFAVAAVAIPMTARGRARLDAWLDPFSNATSTGWQVLQALVAYYTGGVWGVGLGAGSPNAVPIVESDFVWAVVAEELGLAGCAAALLLYGALVFGGFRIASRAKSAYASCVATGLAACLGLQTLLNVGGVVKAIPLTGIPLPLLSHGGSSLVATLVAVGLLLAISDQEEPFGRAPRGGGSPAARGKDDDVFA